MIDTEKELDVDVRRAQPVGTPPTRSPAYAILHDATSMMPIDVPAVRLRVGGAFPPVGYARKVGLYLGPPSGSPTSPRELCVVSTASAPLSERFRLSSFTGISLIRTTARDRTFH